MTESGFDLLSCRQDGPLTESQPDGNIGHAYSCAQQAQDLSLAISKVEVVIMERILLP